LAPHITLAGNTTITGKQVTVVAINNNDYNDYNDSNDDFKISNSYNGTRNELEAEINIIIAECPEINWRRHVKTGAWK
jgi:hypothetical protein